MPSAWITHCKKVYAAGKKKNSDYKYSQAMKDAKSTYKKGSKATEETAEAPKKKTRRRKKKSLKEEEE